MTIYVYIHKMVDDVVAKSLDPANMSRHWGRSCEGKSASVTARRNRSYKSFFLKNNRFDHCFPLPQLQNEIREKFVAGAPKEKKSSMWPVFGKNAFPYPRPSTPNNTRADRFEGKGRLISVRRKGLTCKRVCRAITWRYNWTWFFSLPDWVFVRIPNRSQNLSSSPTYNRGEIHREYRVLWSS